MASTLPPTLQAERRARQHWFQDGLPSLIAGVGCLVWALFWIYLQNGHSSSFKIILLLSVLALYLGIERHQLRIIEWLKARISYPRAGYVRAAYLAEGEGIPLDLNMLSMQGVNTTQPEEIKRARIGRMRRSWVIMPLILLASWTMMIVRNPWVCFAAGLLLSGAFWFGARTERRLSWIVLAGTPLVGLSMSVLQRRGMVSPDQPGLFFAGIGLVFFVDGVASLLRFLRRNPRRKQMEA
jgi:hypothetical protein